MKFWAKEQKDTAFYKEFKLSYVKFKNNLIEAITLSKNLLSLTALEEPAAEDRGFVQSWKTKAHRSEAPVPFCISHRNAHKIQSNTQIMIVSRKAKKVQPFSPVI